MEELTGAALGTGTEAEGAAAADITAEGMQEGFDMCSTDACDVIIVGVDAATLQVLTGSAFEAGTEAEAADAAEVDVPPGATLAGTDV